MTDLAPGAPPLPDFCQPRAVLLVVLLGLILALLLTLSADGFAMFWTRFGLTALFVEVVVLSSSLVLCSAREPLSRRSPAIAYLAIFMLIQLLVVGATLAAGLMLPALTYDADHDLHFSMLRNALIAALSALILLRFLSLHRQWQQQVRAETSARLAALQARIRPHFLFNALNTIASLVRSRPEQAEGAVLDLSDLLRTALTDGARHTLAEELDLVRGYLRIEALRLGDRLAIDWRIEDDAPTEARIPALLIQPLVENAIVHGVARLADGGRLAVTVDRDGRDRWRVVIENPLPPIDNDQGEGEARGGHRIALDNVRKRMELAFGEDGRCRVAHGRSRYRIELSGPVDV